MKYAMVTNIPAPYRQRIHELVSNTLKGEYHVFYAHKIEPDRQWEFDRGSYSHSFLKKRFLRYKNRYIHFSFSIIKELNRLNPQIVITNGFNPIYLYAFLWTLVKRRKHICITDGWLDSERNLSWLHRAVRRIVYRYSSAFIGASKHSLNLYIHYGCDERTLFQSHLCANNRLFGNFINTEKKFEIIFSGQFIQRKMPLFFVDIASKLTKRIGRCRTLVIGDGPQKELFIKTLQEKNIDFYYPGFIQQKDLPLSYASGKILLFPTLSDPWGVVANEACAVGVPVITCDHAGVAGDLIIHGYSGYVLPLDPEIWADHVVRLLNDNDLYVKMSKNALSKVQEFSYENAAQGIVDAVRYVEKNGQ